MATGDGLLDRAIKLARARGMLQDEFAREVVEVHPTTLWRIKKRERALKSKELARIRAFLHSGSKLRPDKESYNGY